MPQPAPDDESKPQQRPQDGASDPAHPIPVDPKLGGSNTEPPRQEDTSDRPRRPTGEFERADTSGRWGMLPPKEAEDLQRRDADEFPQRYRSWMEKYFQRLNALDRRARERAR